MKIRETYRCARCMREMKEEHTFCMECGYDQRQDNPERALPAGTLLNDKYLIGAVIGEGGFGITYAAWDMLIETRIAIKEYFPSELVTRDTTLSGESAAHNLTLIQEKTGEGRYREGLEQFVKEAGNLAKFQKEPGVVSVKDFFYENNTAYMVMEYIEGVTLNTYLENHNGKLGTQEVFRMIVPVMKTLEAIHKEGVIHRDISPDNIMVTEDGQMKLIDFGAARFVGADDEKSLTVILKHGYAPEEQYRSNGEQGPWTDVYALSAVIYRMLTGKVPEETLKRMTSGQDDAHAELRKVPGLSGAERRGLERGLAVRADKRFRTIEGLYERIYSGDKHRRILWKLTAGICIAAVTLLCCFFAGLKNKKADEAVMPTDSATLQNTADGVLNEKESEAELPEEPTEPENIRRLREYYNENCSDKAGNACFADLTGDGEDEMIVTEMSKSNVPPYGYYQEYSLKIYQCQNDTVTTIYEMEQSYDSANLKGIDYYLFMNEDASLLARYWEFELDSSGEWGVNLYKTSYLEKISFRQTDNGITEISELIQEESQEQWRHSLLLLASSDHLEFPEKKRKKLEDYQGVIEVKEGISGAMEIAENAGEAVLDYAVVYNDGVSCTFAVTGVYGEYLHNAPATVWALYNGKIEKVELLDGDAENPAQLISCGIFQFGNSRQYFVTTNVPYQSNIPVQHKFCFENGQIQETDEEYYFVKDENGKVQIAADGYIKTFGESDASVTGQLDSYYVDMFYYNGQYVEYGAEQVDNDILEQFENIDDILRSVEEEFLKGAKIGIIRMGYMDYDVKRIELDHIRRSANNTYFLNYRVYGTFPFWNSDTGGGEAVNLWAHAVVEATGNHLEFKEIVWKEKDEESGLGFPLYYGADRELVKVEKSFTEEELAVLIEEYSGKYIGNVHIYEDGEKVSKKTACYDDFDGDGRHELFAYVANEWTDEGIAEGEETSIWFSDGEQTVLVDAMEDDLDWGNCVDIYTLQFGKNRHFLIMQTNGIRDTWVTTYALDEGKPCTVIKNQVMNIESEDGGTYCRVYLVDPYGPYAIARYEEDYSIFYMDGEYWEYASKVISEKELEKYENGAEIINQIKEQGEVYCGKTLTGDNADFSLYPYIEVEDILLNSENGDIFVNMRHWRSKDEADYYKSLSESNLGYPFDSISYPSETRLSVRDNMLQIEEMRYGHREIKGTEFTPLYPD